MFLPPATSFILRFKQWSWGKASCLGSWFLLLFWQHILFSQHMFSQSSAEEGVWQGPGRDWFSQVTNQPGPCDAGLKYYRGSVIHVRYLYCNSSSDAANLKTKTRRYSTSRRISRLSIKWETIYEYRRGGGGERALSAAVALTKSEATVMGWGNQRTGISQRRWTSSCRAEQRQENWESRQQQGAEFAGSSF